MPIMAETELQQRKYITNPKIDPARLGLMLKTKCYYFWSELDWMDLIHDGTENE